MSWNSYAPLLALLMHPTETTNEDFGSYWVRFIFNGLNNFFVLRADNGAISSVFSILAVPNLILLPALGMH